MVVFNPLVVMVTLDVYVIDSLYFIDLKNAFECFCVLNLRVNTGLTEVPRARFYSYLCHPFGNRALLCTWDAPLCTKSAKLLWAATKFLQKVLRFFFREIVFPGQLSRVIRT